MGDEEEHLDQPDLTHWHVIGAGCVAIWPVIVLVPVRSRRHWGVATPALPVEHFSKSGQKGPRGRGRGRQVWFGGLNVLYDEGGSSYPVDDAGQLYILLEFAQDTGDGEVEVEKQNPIKN